MLNGFFVRKFKILYSSDYPIVLKFRLLVVNIVVKELQMLCWTSTDNENSNENMEELERKM